MQADDDLAVDENINF